MSERQETPGELGWCREDELVGGARLVSVAVISPDFLRRAVVGSSAVPALKSQQLIKLTDGGVFILSHLVCSKVLS